MAQLTRALQVACFDVLEYLEDREDVVDGNYGMPTPNREMQLATELREAMRGAGMRVEQDAQTS